MTEDRKWYSWEDVFIYKKVDLKVVRMEGGAFWVPLDEPDSSLVKDSKGLV